MGVSELLTDNVLLVAIFFICIGTLFICLVLIVFCNLICPDHEEETCLKQTYIQQYPRYSVISEDKSTKTLSVDIEKCHKSTNTSLNDIIKYESELKINGEAQTIPMGYKTFDV